ncbi:MAG: hypothetical protein SFV21_15995 [Rhodospirillaceae bacterium]|nr:hypothetical protein [Rhodospirillaceae bacterium]
MDLYADTYTWVFALHMIVIGYYLGADFVVDQWTWYFIKSAKDTAEERARKLKFLLLCDQHPRMGLILFIATGFSVEALAGLSPLTVSDLWWVWLICAAWFANVWIGFLNEHTSWGRALVNADIGWRYLVGATFLLTGLWSLAGDGPYAAHWMALKYVLLGLLIAGGVSIRFYVRDLAKAWPEFQKTGSTPAFEAVVDRTLFGAMKLTWGLWGLFIAMAVLQIARPF